jgi:hypothetical protein
MVAAWFRTGQRAVMPDCEVLTLICDTWRPVYCSGDALLLRATNEPSLGAHVMVVGVAGDVILGSLTGKSKDGIGVLQFGQDKLHVLVPVARVRRILEVMFVLKAYPVGAQEKAHTS